MMRELFKLTLIFICSVSAWCQDIYPIDGIKDKNTTFYVFTHANIYTDYKTLIKDATLIIKGKHIIAVGDHLAIPEESVVYDLDGKYIYPSFIDLDSELGMPKFDHGHEEERNFAVSDRNIPLYWNPAIKPEQNAADQYNYNKKENEELRKLGFGVVLTFPHDGIVRGSSALVALTDEDTYEAFITNKAAMHFSFKRGESPLAYPTSQMGAISLLRQYYYDIDWYEKGGKKQGGNLSLEAAIALKAYPNMIETEDKLEVLRAGKLGEEFGILYIIKGNGDEYQRINEISNYRFEGFILPVNFPPAYEINDPFDARVLSLSQLMHWEKAPYNLFEFEKRNIPFCITLNGLEQKTDFRKNVTKAISCGLSESAALKALTYTPAKLANVDYLLGSIQKGRIANFVISEKKPFSDQNTLYENWVLGKQYIINNYHFPVLQKEYLISTSNEDSLSSSLETHLIIENGFPKVKANIVLGKDTVEAKVNYENETGLLTINYTEKDSIDRHTYTLTGLVDSSGISGVFYKPNGKLESWKASSMVAIADAILEDKKKQNEKVNENPGEMVYPFCGYGYNKPPVNVSTLIKNVTVWTNESAGILANTDVLLENGKIAAIGKNLLGAKIVIDGNNMHLSPGLIDEHSHIAISKGVNEVGQAITAEVSIADVVNSEDINIYRQLAGGVTTSQLLHGSSNPIGGRSALIKLKWGSVPEEMKIKGADGFIKFALGENVKRSNWFGTNEKRYPNTRMGVEQIMFDAFYKAKEYEQEWYNYQKLSKKEKKEVAPPRKDIELEVLLEILHHERFITCHSYVQSEISMLMNLADSLDFTVNTFTHILEGYKVANQLKEHGAGGSTFSDWWAYKFEVNDAIPYNAAILSKVGVTTAINSDDAEMGRRLNQEAAKAIKYGALSEEEALKLVTLNPAILLHIEDKVGSIKVGKDADLVLWTDNPLSINAKVVKTFIEGRCYYDQKIDQELRTHIQVEKERIIQKMLNSGGKEDKKQETKPEKERIYHCDDIELF